MSMQEVGLRYWGVPATMIVAITGAMALYLAAQRIGLGWLYRVPDPVAQRRPRSA